MFNSIGVMRERDGKIGGIISQRELFDIAYGFQLANAELSPAGQQILNEFKAGWNTDQGRIVWNYGDCWPVNLFTDANKLTELFGTSRFNGGGIQKLS